MVGIVRYGKSKARRRMESDAKVGGGWDKKRKLLYGIYETGGKYVVVLVGGAKSE